MANSRFQSSSRVLLGLFCLFVFLLKFNVFVEADGIFKKQNEKQLDDIFSANDVDRIDRAASASASDSVRLGERSDLCGTDTNSFLPPPYNNISKMACTPVWNNFLLRFHRGEENVMTFILSAIYTTGWLGMGFSRDGMMVGSSAMVGWVNKKGEAKIKQFYLQGTERSKVVANAASASASASAKPSGVETMKRNHGALAIVSWGLLLPVGAIVARYLKHKDRLWYYLHVGFQFLGFLLGLGTVILGQRMYEKINAQAPAHRGIGILLLTLSILQVLAFFLRPDIDAKIRRYWNWYHHWVGRIALFFGAVNIMLGIHLASAEMSLKIGFGFLIAMILLAVIVLETWSWLRKSKENNPPDFQMNRF